MIYKIGKESISQKDVSVNFIDENGRCHGIPFDPANTDYQNFKKQINADEAQLQDADGNTMTAEDAKAYVANLP